MLDTSRCPCPAKRILCTSKKHACDESVMSLEAVVIAGDGAEPCFVFSGHRSGTLQLLSAPPRFRCRARKAHGGAVLQGSSQLVQSPSCAAMEKMRDGVDRGCWRGTSRAGPPHPDHHQPGLSLTQIMPGLIFAVSPGQSLLLHSLSDKRCITMERNPSTAIKCMDVCSPRVSGGFGPCRNRGSLGYEWLPAGRDTSGRSCKPGVFSQRSWGSSRLLQRQHLRVIAGVRYLPVPLLKEVLARAPGDDLPEDPVPFSLRSPSYDLCLVPKTSLKPGEVTFHSTTSAANKQVPDLTVHRENENTAKQSAAR